MLIIYIDIEKRIEVQNCKMISSKLYSSVLNYMCL